MFDRWSHGGHIRSHNSAEYISGAFIQRAERKGIRLEYIHPGNPQQNAYIERYIRTVRRAGWSKG